MKKLGLSRFWPYTATAIAAATRLRSAIIALSTLTILRRHGPASASGAPRPSATSSMPTTWPSLSWSHTWASPKRSAVPRVPSPSIREAGVSDIAVTIGAVSVDTQHEERDKHLRAQDFLWVEHIRGSLFTGTSAEQTGPRTGKITGDLTIRGVTKPVTLDVVWNKSGQYTFGDMHYATGVSARAKIKRSDFGMTYALEGGMVGDEVEIILEFEGIRQST